VVAWKKIEQRRIQLRVQNDFLRLELAHHLEQLQGTLMWIEHGYTLANLLSKAASRDPLAREKPK
jgi:hypothetical protein